MLGVRPLRVAVEPVQRLVHGLRLAGDPETLTGINRRFISRSDKQRHNIWAHQSRSLPLNPGRALDWLARYLLARFARLARYAGPPREPNSRLWPHNGPETLR